MTAANLIGSILFGSIGFGAFMYGKKLAAWKPMVLGVALMVFPYAIQDTGGMYAAGILLTSALFIFRD